MPRLYYTPGACSLAAHILLEESGQPYQAIAVDLVKGEQLRPEYLAIHPLGRVPALVIDDCSSLTENTAILPYLAKRFGLWPDRSPEEEARALELIGYLASSVHVSFSLIGRAARYSDDASAHPGIQAKGRQLFAQHLARLDARLAGRSSLFEHFNAVDAYAFVFFLWGLKRGFDVSGLVHYRRLYDAVLDRPAVQRTLRLEDINPDELRTA